VIRLRDMMDRPEGWGRAQGREVYQRLLSSVETRLGIEVFRISLDGVGRLDMSFWSETVVELAKRFRPSKGVCVVDLADDDMIENLDAAAARKDQPIFIWAGESAKLAGPAPKQGMRDALDFALSRPKVRSTEFAETRQGVSVPNASMKFRSLWEDGYLMRSESASDTGGVEFVYRRVN
jgi:hypothetical protein